MVFKGITKSIYKVIKNFLLKKKAYLNITFKESGIVFNRYCKYN